MTNKNDETAADAAPAAPAKKKADPRAEAWATVLGKVEAQNPIAYAARKEAGEFDKIPDDFDPKNFGL